MLELQSLDVFIYMKACMSPMLCARDAGDATTLVLRVSAEYES